MSKKAKFVFLPVAIMARDVFKSSACENTTCVIASNLRSPESCCSTYAEGVYVQYLGNLLIDVF